MVFKLPYVVRYIHVHVQAGPAILHYEHACIHQIRCVSVCEILVSVSRVVINTHTHTHTDTHTHWHTHWGGHTLHTHRTHWHTLTHTHWLTHTLHTHTHDTVPNWHTHRHTHLVISVGYINSWPVTASLYSTWPTNILTNQNRRPFHCSSVHRTRTTSGCQLSFHNLLPGFLNSCVGFDSPFLQILICVSGQNRGETVIISIIMVWSCGLLFVLYFSYECAVPVCIISVKPASHLRISLELSVLIVPFSVVNHFSFSFSTRGETRCKSCSISVCIWSVSSDCLFVSSQLTIRACFIVNKSKHTRLKRTLFNHLVHTLFCLVLIK